MVPIAPPSLVDKTSPVPPSDSSLLASVAYHGVGPSPTESHPASPQPTPPPRTRTPFRVLQYVEKQLAHFSPTRSHGHQSSSLSELSSLHEGEAGFRQTYRDIQKNALPAIPDRDPAFQSGDDHHHQRCRGNRSPEPQRYQRSPPASQRYRDDRDDGDDRDDRDDPDDGGPLPPRRFSDDPPSSSHTGRSVRKPPGGREPERWNPRSELLQRKAFRSIGPTGSLDELERDAYRRRGEGGRPGDGHRGNEDEGGRRRPDGAPGVPPPALLPLPPGRPAAALPRRPRPRGGGGGGGGGRAAAAQAGEDEVGRGRAGQPPGLPHPEARQQLGQRAPPRAPAAGPPPQPPPLLLLHHPGQRLRRGLLPGQPAGAQGQAEGGGPGAGRPGL
ncbi:LOW QUALITY PROTEIN: trithorax group protein osa-like [Gadus macrocephalus]|uniref:LOW QUALITY PROTEIN: trithorax group protein osa-like n=1 Tax=Gadus macrocephalus TaxID=80720 RepID=UPI0028CB5F4F|nr:LOW QUALITY PROTEIN: trithorax group protein osa-like [Gadus macrocephalus]